MSNKLPIDLINHLKEDPDFNYEAFIAVHDKEEKINSIRLNPDKRIDLSDFGDTKQIPWCENGYYLDKRPVYTLDPLFHAGAYYSQEASSMFLDLAIRSLALNNKEIKAVDLCAAPGGKSTLVNSTLSKDSLLVANEIIKSRVGILSDNLVKWGNPNVIVTNNDPSAFNRLPGYFDLMIVDAPCSGSGMFHKDHAAIDEWSVANVKLCSERQQRIIAASQECLKTGGYIFYSTCSYSREENEDIVDWIIDEFGYESVRIEIESDWGITQTNSSRNNAFSYRFYPHEVGGEGFFFSVLRKKIEQSTFSMKKVKVDKNSAPQNIAKNWIDDTDLYSFIHNEEIHVFPKKYEMDLSAIQKVLYLKNAGTVIGKVMGKDLIPSHDLALSTRIRGDIQAVELNLEDALNYLRRESLEPEINPDNLKGWILVRYKGMNIGWIKAMANRINNYYPKESRIYNL